MNFKWGYDVSALSDARKAEGAVERVSVRAFDKAVRREPLAFAADAVGLWELHVGSSGERVPVVRGSRALPNLTHAAASAERAASF